jgi:hypothetical protein
LCGTGAAGRKECHAMNLAIHAPWSRPAPASDATDPAFASWDKPSYLGSVPGRSGSVTGFEDLLRGDRTGAAGGYATLDEARAAAASQPSAQAIVREGAVYVTSGVLETSTKGPVVFHFDESGAGPVVEGGPKATAIFNAAPNLVALVDGTATLGLDGTWD